MTEVTAIARLKIHEGRFEEFKRLAALCVHSVRTKDSGTLQYDYFFNDDSLLALGCGAPQACATLRPSPRSLIPNGFDNRAHCDEQHLDRARD